jgi:hypothetical protein
MARARRVGFYLLTKRADRGPQELQGFDVMPPPNIDGKLVLCHELAGIQNENS